MSVSQFAMTIAPRDQSWRKYEDNIASCALAAKGTKPIDQSKHAACTYDVQTVTRNARSAITEILRLPTPPAEIKELVDRTITALEPLADSAAVEACADKASERCAAAVTKANADIRAVNAVLDEWKPYI